MIDLHNIPEEWDLIVIGGGVTGAGVLNEAAKMNLRALLIEQNDYAWGTSSRSSKLVHGGLRYLKQGKFSLTLASVRERERLIKESGGLVKPINFLVPVYDDFGPGKWTVEAGLRIYDFMAGEKQHRYFHRQACLDLEPGIRQEHLQGGFSFKDADVDDARLVLRLINEASARGGAALNYVKATEILRDQSGNVVGVGALDVEMGIYRELKTRVVVNASGAWAEQLHPSPESGRHIRPLRGSHLIISRSVLPVSFAVSFAHPDDGRPIFVRPWENAVLVGTTDVDHDKSMSDEPYVSMEEAEYMIKGVRFMFPEAVIENEDMLSCMAGVRPVISRGKADPSEESREHAVWEDKGLVTITGGKLTTFRKTAREVLKTAQSGLGGASLASDHEPVFFKFRPSAGKRYNLPDHQLRRLFSRYGFHGGETIASAPMLDLETAPGCDTLWAELAYAARFEQVRHLSDLLLRRTRVGLLTPDGGREFLDRVHQACAPYLDWGPDKWRREKDLYLETWQRYYSPPITGAGQLEYVAESDETPEQLLIAAS